MNVFPRKEQVMPRMIAVASGKGGAGKTSVAVGMAVCLADRGHSVILVDADVEEPDVLLLFDSHEECARKETSVPRPVFRAELCTGCGRCAQVCRFGAITCLDEGILLLDRLCHSCGGCALACPSGAIVERPRRCGEVRRVEARTAEGGTVPVVEGRLEIGEARAEPVISAALAEAWSWAEEMEHRAADGDGRAPVTLIVDAPPGTSCSTAAALERASAVITVAEPTRFGVHDMTLLLDMLQQLDIRPLVVENKAGSAHDELLKKTCRERGLAVVSSIPFSLEAVKAYSEGIPPMYADERIRRALEEVVCILEREPGRKERE